MKRYKVQSNRITGLVDHWEDDQGEWVRYEDVKHFIEDDYDLSKGSITISIGPSKDTRRIAEYLRGLGEVQLLDAIGVHPDAFQSPIDDLIAIPGVYYADGLKIVKDTVNPRSREYKSKKDRRTHR